MGRVAGIGRVAVRTMALKIYQNFLISERGFYNYLKKIHL